MIVIPAEKPCLIDDLHRLDDKEFAMLSECIFIVSTEKMAKAMRQDG